MWVPILLQELNLKWDGGWSSLMPISFLDLKSFFKNEEFKQNMVAMLAKWTMAICKTSCDYWLLYGLLQNPVYNLMQHKTIDYKSMTALLQNMGPWILLARSLWSEYDGPQQQRQILMKILTCSTDLEQLFVSFFHKLFRMDWLENSAKMIRNDIH